MSDDLSLVRMLLRELYEWALDACHQGTGTEFGTPEWFHGFLSTWENAEELLPRVAAVLAAADAGGDVPSALAVEDARIVAENARRAEREQRGLTAEELARFHRAPAAEWWQPIPRSMAGLTPPTEVIARRLNLLAEHVIALEQAEEAGER